MANEIKTKITADSSQFTSEIDKAEESAGGFGKALSAIGGVATAAFSAAITGAGLAVAAFKESEKASRQLTVALENQGVFAKDVADSYKQYAKEVQRATSFDDDAVVASQAKLQSFIGQTKISKELTFSLADLATQTGSLESAAELLGKAYQGNTRGLKQYGIVVDENASAQDRLDQALKGVNQRFGGQAEATASGLGSLDQLGNAFGELLEVIGEKLAPSITRATKAFTAFLTQLSENNAFTSFIGDVVDFADAIINRAGKALAAFGILISGVFGRDVAQIKVGLEELRALADKPIPAAAVEDNSQEIAAQEEKNKQAKIAAAKAAQDEVARINEANTQQSKNNQEIALLQAQQGSEQVIKLKQQENEILKQLEDERNGDVREALEARLQTTRDLEQQAVDNAAADRAILNDQILAQNAEYNAIEKEQRALFLAENQQALQTQVDNERDVKNKAALATIQEQVKGNNRYLENQQQFGTTYAEINKFIYSAQVQAAAKGFGELTQLQQSNNAALKAIGKAAAVADITIKTAQSAMNVYTAFSTIPFVGQALGIAGAAAAIAFGGEQIGKVLSAQEGGIVPGINRGFDSTPAMLQPGELVVPRQNFDQVVQSVAAQRQSLDAEQAPQPGPAPTQSGMIQIGFDGPEAEKVLTARRVEARSLGTLRDSQA